MATGFGLGRLSSGQINYIKTLKSIKHKMVVFDEVHILFHFNIMLRYKGMSSAKISSVGFMTET